MQNEEAGATGPVSPILALSQPLYGFGNEDPMTIVKPMRLGLLTRAQQEPPKVYWFVTALGYFDLLEPGDFDLDTKMWPTVTPALGNTPLDMGMPKPRGEVVVFGEAVAPGGQPVTQMAVEFGVGPVRKKLTVLGDRHWELTNDGPIFTRPLPFQTMPLTWDRAYGGEGFAANPFGTGHGARAALSQGQLVRLPNIEDASNLILDVEHTPRPVGCAPVDVMNPDRQRYAGTYDDTYLKKHFPGHALDFDWAFYNSVPADQWLPGFLTGDESIRIAGMHPDHPVINSRLPGMRVRAFVNLQRDGHRDLNEIDMRCETIVLFPGLLKGVVIYRGGCEIADIDGKDVVDTLLAYERIDEPKRSVEHYTATLKLRTDPESAALAFFDEKPLRPDIPEVDLAEREAAREALAAERDAKWDKRMESMVAQAYAAVGALPPPPGSLPKAPLPVKIPTITPADIERMDVDMMGVAKALNELKAYGDAQIAEAKKMAGKAIADASKAAAGLLDTKAAARMAAAAKMLPAPTEEMPSVLPSDKPALDTLREALANSNVPEIAGDPMADLLAAIEARNVDLGPLTEEEKEPLRRRAQGLPDDAMIREAMDQLDSIDLTAGGRVEAPDLKAPKAEAQSADELLAKLGLNELTKDVGQQVDDAIAASGVNPDLIKPLMAAKPPELPESDEDPIEKAKKQIEQAGPMMEEAFGNARRMSPEPIAPMEPLRSEQAVFLGEEIRKCLTEGGDFAKRDWAGAILRGVDFSGLDLRGAMFESCDLTDAVFKGANLENAVFTAATLTGADFSGCPMKGANLSKVDAVGANFSGVDLTEGRLMTAKLVGADLSHMTVDNVIALNADFTGANLSSGHWTKVVFMTATLNEAVLDGSTFFQCIFLQAEMNRAKARRAVFTRCAIVASQAREGDYTGADFSNSGSVGGTVYDGSVMRDLIGVKSGWHGASMIGVDLRAARLDSADLGKAVLTDASLTRASLRKSMLSETVMNGADATGATFMEAIMRRVDLREASLRYANLYCAGIDETDLTHCDLTGVNAAGTNLMREADVPG